MRPKHADVLKAQGFTGDLAEFSQVLAEVKAEAFPTVTDEELCFIRDEAGNYCALLRKRLGAPRLTRVFILRALVGIRKHRKVRTITAE